MTFTKRLRDGARRGEITCSVRIWTRPHVKVGGRYPMEEGAIEVDFIERIGLPDITPELARESGFLGVLDLLKVAKHGRQQHLFGSVSQRSIARREASGREATGSLQILLALRRARPDSRCTASISVCRLAARVA